MLPAAIVRRRWRPPVICLLLRIDLGAKHSLDGKKREKSDGDSGSLPLDIHSLRRGRCILSEGEHPSFDWSSAEGGDRSNLTLSDSGQAARFGGGSPIGDDYFAMPVVAGEAEVELPAIEDGDDSHIFADSYRIAENVMASLTSSVAASRVLGMTGSSESRKKSRSPPREIMDRPGRSQQGTPPSRGTARSGASPANTPSRMAAVANDVFLSPMTRQSSLRSIRSDPLGGLASTPAEQASAQMDASMQRTLARGRRDYGPLVGQGRVSPRVAHVGSIWLQLRDVQPPSPPPASVPENTDMGRHYEEIMRELNAKNDAVVALSRQKCDQDRTFQSTEVELQSTQHHLFTAAQQRDMAMDKAKVVSTGQAEVLRQCEQPHMDKTAQASHLEHAVSHANVKIPHLEGMLGETRQHSAEASQLLAGSVSVAYTLEGEAMQLRGAISKQEEEMHHASMVREDLKRHGRSCQK